ncbi:VanZ family protein [Heyndrickxia sp. NPDC080065]|uniref:VanZ family protein n=1 Tax=Heyndrickxia sp. NPDC080065 TaxID=3390568 RepID=UPI003CFD5060
MKINYFTLLLAIVWLIFIFVITASPSATGEHTLNIIQKYLGFNEQVASTVNFFGRKLAHIVVFGMLSVILFFVFKERKLFWSWFFTTLYAVTDELHQLLVEGRTPSIYDVVLDSFAAIIALLLLRLYLKGRVQREKGIL